MTNIDCLNFGTIGIGTTTATKHFGKWLAFHHANPHVYLTIVELAREAKNNRGYTKWGMQGVLEVLRWNAEFTTLAPFDYKLNNNFRSIYSRVIMANEPDLAGFFEIRNAKVENTEDNLFEQFATV